MIVLFVIAKWWLILIQAYNLFGCWIGVTMPSLSDKVQPHVKEWHYIASGSISIILIVCILLSWRL